MKGARPREREDNDKGGTRVSQGFTELRPDRWTELNNGTVRTGNVLRLAGISAGSSDGTREARQGKAGHSRLGRLQPQEARPASLHFNCFYMVTHMWVLGGVGHGVCGGRRTSSGSWLSPSLMQPE